MITITLIGTPTCRRYKKMFQAIQNTANSLYISYTLDEINDIERLSTYNPLSLPRLMINEELVASQNPPSVAKITEWLQQSNIRPLA